MSTEVTPAGMVKEISDLLNEAARKRNTFTEVEFRKYLPLFNPTIKASSFEDLRKEFFNGRDLYSPIMIVDDRGTVLKTLPPILVQSGVGRQDVISKLSIRPTGNTSRPDHDAHAFKEYTTALATMFTTSEYAENVRAARTIRDTFMAQRAEDVMSSSPEATVDITPDENDWLYDDEDL